MKRLTVGFTLVLCACATAPTKSASAPPAPKPAIAGDGHLRAVSTPPGAVVLVDGVDVGKSPVTMEVAAGDHEVIIDLAGYSARARLVTVAGGEVQEAAETLEAEPPDPAAPAAGVPRSLWITRVDAKLAPALCDAPYFKTCFDVTHDECLQAATGPGFACMRESVPSMPAMFDQARGQEWGGKVGACVGTRLEQVMMARRKTLPECNDADHWK